MSSCTNEMDSLYSAMLAIGCRIDLWKACPEIETMEIDKVEEYLENYIHDLAIELAGIIEMIGKEYLVSLEPDELALVFRINGISMPHELLTELAQCVIDSVKFQTTIQGYTPDGIEIYSMKMTIDPSTL